jgi:hypothetical protein
MFFTIQSNIWIGSMCLVFAVLIIIVVRSSHAALLSGIYIHLFV